MTERCHEHSHPRHKDTMNFLIKAPFASELALCCSLPTRTPVYTGKKANHPCSLRKRAAEEKDVLYHTTEKTRHREIPASQLVQPLEGSQSSTLLHHAAFNSIYTLLSILISQNLGPKILPQVCWSLKTGCTPCHCSLFLSSLLLCLWLFFF